MTTVELRLSFQDESETKVVAFARTIIKALRKWRPHASDFSVRVASPEHGVTVVSEK